MSGDLDTLAALVERLDLAVDTDEVAEGYALASRLLAKLSHATGDVDAAGLYENDAAVSMSGWLQTHAGMTKHTAYAVARTARRLRLLPVTRAAWESGALSEGQVQVILANVTDRLAARFAECETGLVPLLARCTVVETVHAMKEWRRRAEAELDEIEREEPASTAHVSKTLDGRVETSGSYDADDGSVIRAALEVAMADDRPDDDERTPAERCADAEVRIHQFFLDQRGAKRHGRERPHVDVVVHVDGDHLRGELFDGTPLPRSTVERLLCDCVAHRVLVNQASVVLDQGRGERTVTDEQFRAVKRRDRHCRAYGCDCPGEYTDVHHVWDWIKGGPTDLDNLVLLCRRHHTLFHKPGWTNELRDDGAYVVTDPRGRTHTTYPPDTLLRAVA